MVNESGQLYTIEGIAAAFLMILTTYLVLSATTTLTPADTHVIDMQIEQLGNDALAIMDTPDPVNQNSALEEYVRNWDNVTFREELSEYLNRVDGIDNPRPLDFNAYVYYRDNGPGDGVILKETFNKSPRMADTDIFVAAHPVTVTRWVFVDSGASNNIWTNLTNPRQADQVMLLEVTLWRD